MNKYFIRTNPVHRLLEINSLEHKHFFIFKNIDKNTNFPKFRKFEIFLNKIECKIFILSFVFPLLYDLLMTDGE